MTEVVLGFQGTRVWHPPAIHPNQTRPSHAIPIQSESNETCSCSCAWVFGRAQGLKSQQSLSTLLSLEYEALFAVNGPCRCIRVHHPHRLFFLPRFPELPSTLSFLLPWLPMLLPLMMMHGASRFLMDLPPRLMTWKTMLLVVGTREPLTAWCRFSMGLKLFEGHCGDD